MAKIMIGHLGFPAPPGLTNYQLGPAMLIMEGVLLPGSCLVSQGTYDVCGLHGVPL